MLFGSEKVIFEAAGRVPDLLPRVADEQVVVAEDAMYSAYSLLNVAIGEVPEPMFLGFVSTSQTRIGPSMNT